MAGNDRSDKTRHEVWLYRCFELSNQSDDPDTRLGCVILGPDGSVRSEGWNRLPEDVRRTDGRMARPAKYDWIEHAERSAIFEAARHGVSLTGSTLYVQLFPCAECARAIILSGISGVVISAAWMAEYKAERHLETQAIAAEMFAEASIRVITV